MSNLIFRWDGHEPFRTSALQALRKAEDFLDVTIACDDDQIKAHKVILSSASPFFQNILKRNPHSHPLLYLRGTKMKDIEAILEFVYSGVTYVNEEELETFLYLAKSSQVHGLCEELPSLPEEKFENSTYKNKRVDNNLGIDHVIENKVEMITENIHVDKFSDDNPRSMCIVVEDGPKNKESEVYNMKHNAIDEYGEKVAKLVNKTETGWSCVNCPYEAKNVGHVREHVEIHIKGFIFNCSYCDKTFIHKRAIRNHERKCLEVITTNRNMEEHLRLLSEIHEENSSVKNSMKTERRKENNSDTSIVEYIEKVFDKDFERNIETNCRKDQNIPILPIDRFQEKTCDKESLRHGEEDTLKIGKVLDKVAVGNDANDSFKSQNVTNTSITEYNQRVSEYVKKTETGWMCSECPYEKKNVGHVREHSEKHVKGYIFFCTYCDKTFKQKSYLRYHKPKCMKFSTSTPLCDNSVIIKPTIVTKDK